MMYGLSVSGTKRQEVELEMLRFSFEVTRITGLEMNGSEEQRTS